MLNCRHSSFQCFLLLLFPQDDYIRSWDAGQVSNESKSFVCHQFNCVHHHVCSACSQSVLVFIRERNPWLFAKGFRMQTIGSFHAFNHGGITKRERERIAYVERGVCHRWLGPSDIQQCTSEVMTRCGLALARTVSQSGSHNCSCDQQSVAVSHI